MSKRVYPQNPSVPSHQDAAQQGYPARRPLDGYGGQPSQQFLAQDQARPPYSQQWPSAGLSNDFQRMQLSPPSEGTCTCTHIQPCVHFKRMYGNNVRLLGFTCHVLACTFTCVVVFMMHVGFVSHYHCLV